MAELADAHGSGPCESDFMQVQVLLSAPEKDVKFHIFFFLRWCIICLYTLLMNYVCKRQIIPIFTPSNQRDMLMFGGDENETFT